MTIPKQIFLAAIFSCGQVFVFCRLINEDVLERFLIMCKEHTLSRSANLLSRNHTILCFWLRREGRQMPNIYWFAVNVIVDNTLNVFLVSAKLRLIDPFGESEKSKLENYRSVSLNCFSKIYENFLHNQCRSFVDKSQKEFISKGYSLSKGYSTSHVLIRLIENWRKALNINLVCGIFKTINNINPLHESRIYLQNWWKGKSKPYLCQITQNRQLIQS